MISSITKLFHSLSVCFISLIILTACSHSSLDVHDDGGWKIVHYTPSTTPKPFEPAQVSCTDISSPELRKELKAVKDNTMGDMYWPSNEATGIVKKVADKGNIDAIFFFGDMRYERIFIENKSSTQDKNYHFIKGVIFPDNARPEMVEALTYIRIAAIPASQYKNNAIKLSQQIEQNRTITVPSEWIAEAKANAQAWKAHCGSY